MTAQSDDDLLDALGDAARAEDDAAWDPRWDALAAGTLSPADRAALEALAAQDPEAAALLDVLAPPAEALDDAIVATILAETRSDASADEGAPILSLPKRPRRPARWIWATGALAAAAAALFLLLPSRVVLPAYTLESHAGERVLRSDHEPTVAVYGAGSQVDLILRPAVDVQDPVAVRVFHAVGDTVRPLPVELKVSPNGIIRLRGRVDELLPEGAGLQRLIFAVGAPDALPKSVDALQRGRLNGADEWQALQHEYRRR